MNLQEFFEKHNKIALGFSGGVDSSYLLYAANKYGADVSAYFIKTQFQPDFELEDARKLAEDIGATFKILKGDALADEKVAANPSNRCYYCKLNVFGMLMEAAKADGYYTIIDGTNASDDAGDRPGMKALKEMKVFSPLKECGLTKADVRKLSKEAGLFTWEKPSYACLATRVQTGETITNEILERVEAAEAALFEMGYSDFRVRVLGNAAKLQMNSEYIEKVFKERKEIKSQLAPYFDDVLLDLKER